MWSSHVWWRDLLLDMEWQNINMKLNVRKVYRAIKGITTVIDLLFNTREGESKFSFHFSWQNNLKEMLLSIWSSNTKKTTRNDIFLKNLSPNRFTLKTRYYQFAWIQTAHSLGCAISKTNQRKKLIPIKIIKNKHPKQTNCKSILHQQYCTLRP